MGKPAGRREGRASPWQQLNLALLSCTTAAQVERIHKVEKGGPARPSFLRRIASRHKALLRKSLRGLS